jgi:hypothetical protein
MVVNGFIGVGHGGNSPESPNPGKRFVGALTWLKVSLIPRSSVIGLARIQPQGDLCARL